MSVPFVFVVVFGPTRDGSQCIEQLTYPVTHGDSGAPL